MSEEPRRAGLPASARLLVVLLGSVTAIGPLSMDMYLPAFPTIAGDLDVPAAQVQLSLTTCIVGLAVGQLVFGPLSDRWGRRRPLVAAVAAYAVLSLLIALAPSAPVLSGLRLLQGVAGGAGIVIARAIVRDLYEGPEAARFFSRLTLIFGVAPVLAPTVGSAVLRVTSWHGIFVALGLIAVALTAVLAVRLPATLPPERRSTGGLADIATAARSLFRDRIFLGYALTQALALAALFVYLAGSSFVLQDGYGLSPTVYGLLFGLNAVGLIVVGQANAWLVDRFPIRALLLVALVVQTLSGALVLGSALLGHLPGLLAGLFLLIATVGMVPPNATTLALDRHPSRAGTAAALLGGLQSVIAAVAAPLAGLGDPGRGAGMGALILAFGAAALLTVPLLTSERRRLPGVPPA